MKAVAGVLLAVSALLPSQVWADFEPNDDIADAETVSTLGPGASPTASLFGTVNTGGTDQTHDPVDFYRVPYTAPVVSVSIWTWDFWMQFPKELAKPGVAGEMRRLSVAPSGGLSRPEINVVVLYGGLAYILDWSGLFAQLNKLTDEMQLDDRQKELDGVNDIPLKLDIKRAIRLCRYFHELLEIDGSNADYALIAQKLRREYDANPYGSSYILRIRNAAYAMADLAEDWDKPRFIGDDGRDITDTTRYKFPVYERAPASTFGYLAIRGEITPFAFPAAEPACDKEDEDEGEAAPASFVALLTSEAAPDLPTVPLPYHITLTYDATNPPPPPLPEGTPGDDRMEGRNGRKDRLSGLGGNDKLFGLSGDDDLDGGVGNDLLDGGDDDDSLDGGSGRDNLLGGRGDDRLSGGPDGDTLDGGPGIDTADFSEKTASVSVTLRGSRIVDVLVGGKVEDRIRNIENVIGGRKGDSLRGDGLANHLRGGLGDDWLVGGPAPDRLEGGPGNDLLTGGPARDVIIGGPGRDQLRGDLGPDRYVFQDIKDSPRESRPDMVSLRRPEGDKIDLSAIDADSRTSGDQAFRWRGAAAFSGRAGELRVEGKRLQVDVDGDRRPDFHLWVTGQVRQDDIVP